ncbi:2-dehydropantoate 2-reductase [Clostridium sp. BJN0001]|uniref:ketopantoate reductase family protein n=1 Tax=Clostridium sp. BJN0001 TaxID=2930219 RepID=UPI001FD26122|nr:2-dehydropantoate 2-reductase [Clostridium sp. BJN0001]
MKIGIIGIGANGTYIASKLLRAEEDVYLFAEGEMLSLLKRDGITLKDGNLYYKNMPKFINDFSEKQDMLMDIVFVCVKSECLEKAAAKIKNFVGEYTIVIPVVSGVNSCDKLYRSLKKGKIIDSAFHSNLRLIGTGIVYVANDGYEFIISSNSNHPVYKINLDIVKNVLDNAKVECIISDDAQAKAWDKYVFNCAFNITDSYYDVGADGILQDRIKFETFCNIAKECENVGRSRGIKLNPNIYNIAINCLKKLSKKAISTMHKDLIRGRKFELEAYCGDLCRMANDVGVSIPYSKMAYESLKMLQPA